MSNYCKFIGVSINDSGEESNPIFIGDYPKIVIIFEDGIKRVNLYTRKIRFKKNFPAAEPSMYLYIHDILNNLSFLFPEIKVSSKNQFAEIDVYKVIKRDEYSGWDLDEWDREFESKLIERIFILLINHGWELMDKEGLWFCKK